ncbi:hypothetical protein LZF95_10280 [Algoriphagus sp. AGSA1]|uniref:hypothetical protein n=1 Tax=Algoriphagus sp. AGSA1 TaxID=2907213 RepID=UPI001F3A35CC|nr:hypothetical protein [Algoriphagus sp. AGSA1]MCE7055061.1 hypothetical protein [Algoriphagus sp. AGSA1]
MICKLILFMPLWFLPQLPTSDYLVLIVDDCQLARHMETGNIPEQVLIALNYNDNRKIVSLSNTYVYPEDRLSTMSMKFSEILESNPSYTSDLKSFDAWVDFAYRRDKKKIFILIPRDYCSGKRFVSDQSFTLYEVRVALTHDE